jgi:ketosteroid isomerase-like protein
MTKADAEAFAADWLAAWNDHDIESILAHFEDEVVFTSPLAAQLVPHSAGIVRGKQALRKYWTRAIDRIPALHFTLLGVYAGLDTIVIRFGNERGEERCEVLRLSGGLAYEGHGTYAVPSSS